MKGGDAGGSVRPWTSLSADERELVRMQPYRLRNCMLLYYTLLVLLFVVVITGIIVTSVSSAAWPMPTFVTLAGLCWLGAASCGAVALRSLGAGWFESLGVSAIDFVLTPAVLVLMVWSGVVSSPSLLHSMLKGRIREKRAALEIGEITWADDSSLRAMLRAWSKELIRLGYCPKCRCEIGTLARCPECGLRMSGARWGDYG